MLLTSIDEVFVDVRSNEHKVKVTNHSSVDGNNSASNGAWKKIPKQVPSVAKINEKIVATSRVATRRDASRRVASRRVAT